MTPTGGLGPDEPRPIRPYLQTPPTRYEPPTPDKLTETGQPGSPKLRPFVLTSGRVAAEDPNLGLETQVTAQVRGGRIPTARLSPELRAIVTLCDEPISIAEISARLKLHLGVVKILVSDLRATGYLDVHAQDAGSLNTPELILRVIRGLSSIT
jgi:hypothetical protein